MDGSFSLFFYLPVFISFTTLLRMSMSATRGCCFFRGPETIIILAESHSRHPDSNKCVYEVLECGLFLMSLALSLQTSDLLTPSFLSLKPVPHMWDSHIEMSRLSRSNCSQKPGEDCFKCVPPLLSPPLHRCPCLVIY